MNNNSYPNCDPADKSVAQFPGSRYPTAITKSIDIKINLW
jgi:hypothetical protein